MYAASLLISTAVAAAAATVVCNIVSSCIISAVAVTASSRFFLRAMLVLVYLQPPSPLSPVSFSLSHPTNLPLTLSFSDAMYATFSLLMLLLLARH